ncbi:hypothetical protein DPMN_181280 [Dreissena polymorpha]|uniref:Uncharacterized protein n=1 Tax=Dreissena polymorpha TaxID=45954 RepID=A0A9D4DDV4_DREPO|nr:hypothetical protein DPMN_181280 [Dreissena polymorpha]
MQPGLLRASSAAELLAFNKWYLRLVAPAGRALARLALYNRPMSLRSNNGPRRSASFRETGHIASDSIGTVPNGVQRAHRDCCPCRYTEIAAIDRLSAEHRPSVAIAETNPRGRVRWVCPLCSERRPRSQAETNGHMGPERDSPTLRHCELGSPTRPARTPVP